MRNDRYVTPQESDYKVRAEDLSTQLHILKLRYRYIIHLFQDAEQNRQSNTIAGYRFWPSLFHRLFHRARQQ